LRDLFQRFVDTYHAFPVFGSESCGELEWLTYTEFGALVIPFARGLQKMGIEPGDLILVLIENSIWFALSQWSLAYHGAVIVPVPDNMQASVIALIIRTFRIRVLFCSDATFTRLPEFLEPSMGVVTIVIICDSSGRHRTSDSTISSVIANSHVNVVDLPHVLRLGESTALGTVSASSLASINFSSGRSGNLKACAVSHSNVIASSVGLSASGYRFGKEVYLSSISLVHPFERSMQLTVMAHGGCIGFLNRSRSYAFKVLRPTVAAFTAQELDTLSQDLALRASSASLVKRFAYDIGFSIASQAREAHTEIPWLIENFIIKPFRDDFGGRLRLLVSTGSWLPPRVQNLLKMVLQIPVIQVYGTAETGGVICVQNVSDIWLDRAGAPATTCEIRLRDFEPGGNKVSKMESGEILVRGANVFVGYYENKKATGAALSADGWFATGDLGKLKPNGTIEVIDSVAGFLERRKKIRAMATGKIRKPLVSPEVPAEASP
jgi:long-chain acyl-CoA synthetase